MLSQSKQNVPLYIVELWKNNRLDDEFCANMELVCAVRCMFVLQVDTRNILFICGGAFFGLEKIVSERLYS